VSIVSRRQDHFLKLFSGFWNFCYCAFCGKSTTLSLHRVWFVWSSRSVYLIPVAVWSKPRQLLYEGLRYLFAFWNSYYGCNMERKPVLKLKVAVWTIKVCHGSSLIIIEIAHGFLTSSSSGECSAYTIETLSWTVCRRLHRISQSNPISLFSLGSIESYLFRPFSPAEVCGEFDGDFVTEYSPRSGKDQCCEIAVILSVGLFLSQMLTGYKGIACRHLIFRSNLAFRPFPR